ncbi:MAG: DUF1045 domain-containing protein, partial [Pseudomonadota bacterium]
DQDRPDGVAQPEVAGFSAPRIREITESARHYGFHATLKPPFALAAGRTADELLAEIEAFVETQRRIPEVRLKVGSLDGFMALVLRKEMTEIRALADACVRSFDSFRSPPSDAELERRRKAPLTDHQDMLLERWGYPYVMDAFRFHMTLTCRLPASDRERLQPSLEAMFGPAIENGVSVDGISLFQQDDRQSPFRRIAHYAFGNATA